MNPHWHLRIHHHTAFSLSWPCQKAKGFVVLCFLLSLLCSCVFRGFRCFWTIALATHESQLQFSDNSSLFRLIFGKFSLEICQKFRRKIKAEFHNDKKCKPFSKSKKKSWISMTNIKQNSAKNPGKCLLKKWQIGNLVVGSQAITGAVNSNVGSWFAELNLTRWNFQLFVLVNGRERRESPESPRVTESRGSRAKVTGSRVHERHESREGLGAVRVWEAFLAEREAMARLWRRRRGHVGEAGQTRGKEGSLAWHLLSNCVCICK